MADNQINITLFDALKCLNKFSLSESYLGFTVQEVLQEVEDARESANYSRAWYLVQRVLDVCENYGVILECAEAHTKCSVEVSKLGYLVKAAELLEVATGFYHSYEHQRGIVHWMLGCVLWQCRGQENEAISTWRRSIQIFESIPKNRRFLSSEERNWYGEWIDEMKSDLNTAMENRDLREMWVAGERDHNSSATGEDFSQFTKVDQTPQYPVKPRFRKVKGYLQGFPIVGRIPAGTPQKVIPSFENESRIDQVTIDETPYQIYRIDGSGGKISIDIAAKHYLLRVIGDSMNLTNIQDQDLVFIRQADHANHNDIVVVELVGLDDNATLKRYVVRKDKIVFQPESTNPEHNEFVIRSDDEYRIHGKAIAVLKKDQIIPEGSILKFSPVIDSSIEPMSPEEKLKFIELYNRCGHDRQRAWRLIGVERIKKPLADLRDLIDAAIIALDRDND